MKATVIALFMLIAPCMYAQEYAETYSSDTVQSEIRHSAQTTAFNAVKWDIAVLGRGVFMLQYERALLSWLSAEIGLGATHTDFIYKAEVATSMFSYSYKYKQLSRYGLAYSGALRFYPRSMDNLTGMYLSLGAHGRFYRFATSSNKVPNVNTRVFMHDARFVVGWQKESERIKDLVWDYYLGVGIRTVKDEYYDIDLRAKTTGYAEHPIIIVGIKMGLPF